MKKGFTLIELMIVIAIIAFLSMVSVPGLMRLLAKSKRTEAYLCLRSLAQAQKVYFAEHGHYAKTLGGLGWKPEGTFNYTYGFSQGAEGEAYFMGQSQVPASALAGAAVTSDGFTLRAAGLIYGEKPDIISLDHQGVITLVSDALG